MTPGGNTAHSTEIRIPGEAGSKNYNQDTEEAEKSVQAPCTLHNTLMKMDLLRNIPLQPHWVGATSLKIELGSLISLCVLERLLGTGREYVSWVNMYAWNLVTHPLSIWVYFPWCFIQSLDIQNGNNWRQMGWTNLGLSCGWHEWRNGKIITRRKTVFCGRHSIVYPMPATFPSSWLIEPTCSRSSKQLCPSVKTVSF